MRLTLRTLLAYMDDMLDPADQEELARKIEASPFATELIHRSRDAVRRLRLSAPEPLASESGDLHGGDHYLDANTAAEYLDSILPPDDVAEFERHCLEAGPHADMLLAEAASCHHILTLVLGEPAEVDADLRQRMYQIIEQSEPQPATAASAAAPSAVAAVSEPLINRRPKVDPDEAAVPDYILEAARARRRKGRQLLLMAGAFLIGCVGAYLYLTRPGEPETPAVAQRDEASIVATNSDDLVGTGDDAAGTGGQTASTGDAPSVDVDPAGPLDVAPPFVPSAPTGAADQTGAPGPAVTPPAADATGTGIDSAASPAAGDTPPAAPVDPLAPAPGGEVPAVPTTTVDPAGALADGGLIPGATTTAPPLPTDPGVAAALDPATAVAPPLDPAANVSPTGNPLADAGPVMPPVEPTAGPGAPPVPTDPAAVAATDLANIDPTNIDPATVDPAADIADAAADFQADAAPGDVTGEPAAPKQLGAYLGLNNDLLLHYDEAADAWIRLPPRSMLAGGERLLVLPNFRTLVVLGADVNAYLGGGTEVTLTDGGGEPAADFGLALPYGRVILNAGVNGNRVALTMGDNVRVLELGPSSSLAIEVARTFVRGADPAKEPAPMAISYFLTSGKAKWNDGAADHSAEGPATWTTVDGADQPPLAISELPEWINKEPMSNVDADARDDVAEKLVNGQPVNMTLLELTSPSGLGRRTEVRALASRSGTYVGEFESLVKALADPNERSRRKEQVDTLRAAIARDPASAEKIYDALALQRGQNAADDLMQMLLGYGPAIVGTTRDEVKEGVLVRLITWLNDDDLAYRVLASHNINEITGTSYLGGYRPEHTARQRDREIRYYWDRLEKGELMPKP